MLDDINIEDLFLYRKIFLIAVKTFFDCYFEGGVSSLMFCCSICLDII